MTAGSSQILIFHNTLRRNRDVPNCRPFINLLAISIYRLLARTLRLSYNIGRHDVGGTTASVAVATEKPPAPRSFRCNAILATAAWVRRSTDYEMV